MIIKGSLGYDQHGRKRKRLRTKRKSQKSTWTQGAVAQQGERRTCTAKVAGSIPVSSTMHGKATHLFFSNGYCLLTRRVACN